MADLDCSPLPNHGHYTVTQGCWLDLKMHCHLAHMHPTQVAAILHEYTQLQLTVTRTLWSVVGQHQVMCGVSEIVAKTSTQADYLQYAGT